MNTHSRITAVLGLGSPHGDDQFGWSVVDALTHCRRALPSIHVRLVKLRHPIDVISWINDQTQVHLIDAAVGCPIDQVLRLRCKVPTEWRTIECLPAKGTHDLSLGTVLGTAESLDKPIESVTLWLGPAQQCSPIQLMSARTAEAVDACARKLEQTIRGAGPLADPNSHLTPQSVPPSARAGAVTRAEDFDGEMPDSRIDLER
ncbi:hypothetical protein FYK55_01260 [Roseiconus nitratireducens]|uniref:Hydrogenase maturation protease n=1 Tax=Roseiconus nitratireducens TaxID=2605748 RepID=A0A5M6DL03_9BACT|nr:hypothetical protein [Roseiconus nitratireducens]KAA5547076.1 hypothetical protein FYK55_01260 [Roseiconus nitratireducens]